MKYELELTSNFKNHKEKLRKAGNIQALWNIFEH